jgi:hypothetical protein
LNERTITAVVGTAINNPTKPRKYPKMRRDKIRRTGCSPTFEPMILGARMVFSTIF